MTLLTVVLISTGPAQSQVMMGSKSDRGAATVRSRESSHGQSSPFAYRGIQGTPIGRVLRGSRSVPDGAAMSRRQTERSPDSGMSSSRRIVPGTRRTEAMELRRSGEARELRRSDGTAVRRLERGTDDSPVRRVSPEALRSLQRGPDSTMGTVEHPAAEKMSRMIPPTASRGPSNPAEVRSEFRSSGMRIKQAIGANDRGMVDTELNAVRSRAGDLRNRLQNLTPENKLKVGSVARMYQSGVDLIEEGRQSGENSKVELGLEKLEQANRQLEQMDE